MVVPVRVVQPKGYGAPGPESKALQGRARVALVVGVLLTTAAGRAAHFTPPPKSTEPEACPLTRAPVLACGCDKGMRKGPGESGAGPGSIRARPQVSFAPFSAGSAGTTTDWPARRPTLPCTFTSIAEMNRGGQDAQGKARASVAWSLQGVGGWAPSAGEKGPPIFGPRGKEEGDGRKPSEVQSRLRQRRQTQDSTTLGGSQRTSCLSPPNRPTPRRSIDNAHRKCAKAPQPPGRAMGLFVETDRDCVRGDSATPVLNRQERYASLQDPNALGTIGTTVRSGFRRARVAIVIHVHTPFFLPD